MYKLWTYFTFTFFWQNYLHENDGSLQNLCPQLWFLKVFCTTCRIIVISNRKSFSGASSVSTFIFTLKLLYGSINYWRNCYSNDLHQFISYIHKFIFPLWDTKVSVFCISVHFLLWNCNYRDKVKKRFFLNNICMFCHVLPNSNLVVISERIN